MTYHHADNPNFPTINEIWNPGPRPDPHDSAVALIGADAVKIIEDAGMKFETHFWDITRAAVATARSKL